MASSNLFSAQKMQKYLTVSVPKYVKKFVEYEFPPEEDGWSRVKKNSWLGEMIDGVSFELPISVVYPEQKGSTVRLRYFCRNKVWDVPPFKIVSLRRQLDEGFRSALIREVRRLHYEIQGDYTPLIEKVLKDWGIERDVDVDFETLRKIYRDHMKRIAEKRQKNMREMSAYS